MLNKTVLMSIDNFSKLILQIVKLIPVLRIVMIVKFS
jgi:hypothetical protein